MRNTLYILLALVTLFLQKVSGEENSSYYFTHINGDNGLSSSNVKAIIQDSYGFMWFGTKNGLNRFDGTSILRMNCEDHQLKKGNNNISALYEDANRTLWVGTDRGVYLYHPASDVFTHINQKTKEGKTMDNWVSAIVGDTQGNIWVIIPDQGIFRYKDNELYFYEISNRRQFKQESPNCICVRENGEVWIGFWGLGICRYNPQNDSFEQIVEDRDGRPLVGKNINSICEYGDWLIMAANEGELIKYNTKSHVLEDIKVAGADNTFYTTGAYMKGKIWLGTFNGLYVIDEKKNEVVSLKEDLMRSFSLSDKMIYSMCQDSEGGIWIGTLFGGVNYLPNRNLQFDKFVPGSSGNSLNTKRIRELAEDVKGNIWIGTEDAGISVLNVENGVIRQVKDHKSGNHLVTLAVVPFQDQIYCGLFKAGLDVIQVPGYTVRHYTPSELKIGEGSVYVFHIDRKGRKWLGTGWGLYVAEAGSFNFVNVKETGYNWIFDLCEGKDGSVWIATMGSGVWRYSPQTDSYKKYESKENEPDGLSSNSVSSVMQDSKGRVWFSTDRGGICYYNEEKDNFVTYSIKEGLPDDVAYKILEDEEGNLWFGTNRGLVRFHPDKNDIRVFTTKDGLLGNQFNYKSALKARNGKFYFGGIDGLVAFDPREAKTDDFVPPIYISKFSIYNKEVTVHTADSPLKECITHTDRIVLNYDESNISFDVALLSYSTAEANQYYYRMAPIDKDWIKAATNQNISYAKLPPGQYTFQVKATSNDNGGQFVERSLSIEILPPWWFSPWAYVFYFIWLVCVVVSWFFWYKHRKEKEMEERQKLFEIEKEKELYESKVNFFTEIAHEVRTPLTLINGPLETLQEMEIADPKIQKNLSVITQNTNRLLTLTGQLLDFQKIGAHKFEMTMECVDITSLLRETVARFEPTISKKNKELALHIPEESIEAVVDKEAITKILSNLLNNALKYARHSICVELQRETEAFLVRVTSDGDKIPAEISQQIFEPFYQAAKKDSASFGVGIGLPLARSLASLHRGKLYLDSEHEDNSFVLSVPLVENTLRSLPKLEEITVETDTLGEGVPVEAEMKSYVLLLVEDNETMLEFMSERLLEVFTVETAKNGQEALEVLRSRRIDLVISDIMMPVMNGWELCKEIKSDMDLSHIPVIFLTAKNDIDSKINGLKIGAEAYVEKPFSFNYLKTQIVSLLYNRQKEREAFSKRPFFPTNKMQMNKVDEEFMNKVIRTIEENIIDTNLNVEHLAEILGMSRSSLLRKIKMLSNLSPVDFIRLIRLRKAAELIHEGKYLIGDICFMVGINSPSYFSKLFLKQFGMTPKDFEKQSQADKEKIDMPS